MEVKSIDLVYETYHKYWEEAFAKIPKLREYFANVPSLNVKSIELFPAKFKSSSGVAITKRGGYQIDINSFFVDHHLDQVLNTTIPHEISHIIQWVVYPRAKQAHGPEWRKIMRYVFGIDDAKTYHSLDTSKLYEDGIVKKKAKTRHIYICGCSDDNNIHTITKNRHNKIQNGVIFRCVECKVAVIDTGKFVKIK